MHTEHNSLLAQVPLTVSPFIVLPKAPTLPHNYATLPSTLPPSILSSPPSNNSNPATSDTDAQLAAYVTSASGFRAHPSTIIAQNRALRSQLSTSADDARKSINTWLDHIKDRELAEKRRKAPGWLDSDEKMLRPERPSEAQDAPITAPDTLLNAQHDTQASQPKPQFGDVEVNDLGAQMDRAFG